MDALDFPTISDGCMTTKTSKTGRPMVLLSQPGVINGIQYAAVSQF
jgi:hypothetical protein